MNVTEYLHQKLHISPGITAFVLECEKEAGKYFTQYEEIAQAGQFKVIETFKRNMVSARHFYPSTGYGYGDEGRDKLSQVFADVFEAEKAIVSPLIMSGTHAISLAVTGVLRPGDGMLSLTGAPYDTLKSTVQSLSQHHIAYRETPLIDGAIDITQVLDVLRSDPSIKMVYIQRSTGYDIRKAFTTAEISNAIAAIKPSFPDKIYMVDNCYGEFVCEDEPVQAGADIIAGSLIKNPGGGLAPTGGYIAGGGSLIDLVADRFSAPGVGTEIGSYAYGYQPFFQGLFMAPHTVLQALKGVILASVVFDRLGYATTPAPGDVRGDITQTILFNNEEKLTAFVRGIQKASAIDGHVVPYAWDMPGYDDKVIMAAGTFVQGASLELTADAPIREPYCAYLQGALTYEHAKIGMLYALQEMHVQL